MGRSFGVGLLWGWVALFGVCWLAAQNVSEQYLLDAANRERAAMHLGPVRVEQHLALAARLHADEMAAHRTISHQFEGERELASRAADAGAHFSLITENVAEASNSAVIHDMWMNSPGHRANLLDPQVDSVGIAVVQRKGQLYAVEDFARTVDRLSLEQQESMVADLVRSNGLTVVAGRQDARQTCTMSTGFVGSPPPGFVMRYTSTDIRHLPPELVARMATRTYQSAAVGACVTGRQGAFTNYSVAVMLYR